MNQPERSHTYILREGQQKMTYQKDEKIPNAALYKINAEDHTVGNVLRMALLDNEKVTFASYQHPHPTDTHIIVKIQCKQGTEPTRALEDSITKVRGNLELLADVFKKATNEAIQNQQEEDNQGY
jgi:DNA-directed RNA polymerase II subunit RPB11|tara:strand:+ start:56 stop:430 length:375 start_codon:yes stop_codon:yes gene_type:complete